MNSKQKYGDMTLANVVGEEAEHVINQLQDDFNSGTTDIQYARDTLRSLEQAARNVRAAIVCSKQDLRVVRR